MSVNLSLKKLSNLPIDFNSIKISAICFAKAIATVTVAQIVINRIRLSKPHISVDVSRRALRSAVCILVPTFFFTRELFLLFLKNHPSFVIFFGLEVLSTVNSFRPILEKQINKKLDFSPLSNASESLAKLLNPKWTNIKLTTLEPYSTILDIACTVLKEEFCYRGLFQEVFLRQLPKITLGIIGMSPEIVDYTLAKVTRIAISALFFGFAHIRRHTFYDDWGYRARTNSFAVYLTGIGGLYLGAMKEELVLSHA